MRQYVRQSSHLYNIINKELLIYPLTYFSCKKTLTEWLKTKSYDEIESLVQTIIFIISFTHSHTQSHTQSHLLQTHTSHSQHKSFTHDTISCYPDSYETGASGNPQCTYAHYTLHTHYTLTHHTSYVCSITLAQIHQTPSVCVSMISTALIILTHTPTLKPLPAHSGS